MISFSFFYEFFALFLHSSFCIYSAPFSTFLYILKLFLTCKEVIRHNNNSRIFLFYRYKFYVTWQHSYETWLFTHNVRHFHTPIKLFSIKSVINQYHNSPIVCIMYTLLKKIFLYSSACFLIKLGSFRNFSALFASFRIFSSVTALFALHTHPFSVAKVLFCL